MIRYKGCVGDMEVDPVADLIHGDVIGLRDVITFQGQSVPGALHAFRDSVDDDLSWCAAKGRAAGKTFNGTSWGSRHSWGLRPRLYDSAPLRGLQKRPVVNGNSMGLWTYQSTGRGPRPRQFLSRDAATSDSLGRKPQEWRETQAISQPRSGDIIWPGA